MSNQAERMYRLTHNQIVSLIASVGPSDAKTGAPGQAFLVEGDMGSGKTSILHMLAERFKDTHVPMYFDCTTKDLGDVMIPDINRIDEATGFVRFVPNEEFGLHLGKPVILMLDEYGKANPGVKTALTRVLQEYTIGAMRLPPGSIVFCTTNLGAEGVGDMLAAHQRNRITVVRMAKPSAEAWIDWGINNGIDPAILSFVRENPQLMQSFDDVGKNAEDNPYIFHPNAQRTAFVTPRSLEAASNIVKQRKNFDQTALTAALMGTIGQRAAMDMAAFIDLADQLPSIEDIKTKPETAPVPTSAAAKCMVVYRSLSLIDEEWAKKGWLDNWMTYLKRLGKEEQALFCIAVMTPGYRAPHIVCVNDKFHEYAKENNFVYAEDV